MSSRILRLNNSVHRPPPFSRYVSRYIDISTRRTERGEQGGPARTFAECYAPVLV